MKESAVVFGKSARLVGIVTEPTAPVAARRSPAVVLLNWGMVHRVGPNRLYVRISRHLAARGHLALRFDLSGLGDSGVSADNLPFETRALNEAREAMDYLSQTRGVGTFILAGICSGAVTAFNAAREDLRVVAVAMINPQQYDEDLTSYVEARRWGYWRAALLTPRRWLRVLTGKADYEMLLVRLKGIFVGKQKAAAAAQQVVADFRSLIDRGVEVLIVYSGSDWGLDYYDMVLGNAAAELTTSGRLKIERIEDTDHIFTPLHCQERLLSLLEGCGNTATAGGRHVQRVS